MEPERSFRGRASLVITFLLGCLTFAVGGLLSAQADPMTDDMWLFPLVFVVGPLGFATLIAGVVGYYRTRHASKRTPAFLAVFACLLAIAAIPFWATVVESRADKELQAIEAETEKSFTMTADHRGYNLTVETDRDLSLTGSQLARVDLMLAAWEAPYPPSDDDSLQLLVSPATNPTVVGAVRAAGGSLPCTITLDGMRPVPALLMEYGLAEDPAGEAFVTVSGKSARDVYSSLAATAE